MNCRPARARFSLRSGDCRNVKRIAVRRSMRVLLRFGGLAILTTVALVAALVLVDMLHGASGDGILF